MKKSSASKFIAANWANKTIWTADNLPVMRGMNSDSIDLIYLDPPFNSNADYAAPIGSRAAGAEFKDTWNLTDIDVEWITLIADKHPALQRVLLAAPSDSRKSYLVYMAVRLLEMHRILKPTGSIYLHCDPTMGHHLKLLLDALFGYKNFRNEIVWGYDKPRSAKWIWKRNHDTLLFHTKSAKWTFHPQRVPTLSGKFEIRAPVKRPDGSVWKPKEPGKQAGSWWYDIPSFATRMTAKERTGYPTQKPLALLERIIRASSREGDIVFDPFCGCATTLAAADALNRQWVGIDISPKAAELIIHRIEDQQGLWRKIVHRTDIPQRTDLGKLPAPIKHRDALYGIQHGNCAACGEHFRLPNMEIDHIIAKSKGGTDHIDNLQLLCGRCNRLKGDRGMEYLRARLQLD